MPESYNTYLENHLPLITIGQSDDSLGESWFTELNEELEAALELPMLTPEIGCQRIHDVLANYDLQFPLLSYDQKPDHDEHVYAIEGNEVKFLYMAYFQLADGTYEFYAEIMDESTLLDVLASTEEDESME